MQLDGSARPLMRLYAIVASLLLLSSLPAAIMKVDVVRVHPVALPYTPAPDGTLHTTTVDGRRLRLTSVSVDGGEPIPAGGVAFLRDAQSIPAGTVLRYRAYDERSVERSISGTVSEAAAPLSRTLQQLVAIIIAAVFALAGLGIAIAAADRRAALAAAAMSGAGLLFGPLFSDATMAALPAAGRTAALLVWQFFPRPLGLYWLPAFAAGFPQPLPNKRFALRALLLATLACALAATVFNAALQLPHTIERLPLRVQQSLIVAANDVQDAGYALFLASTLAAIAAQRRARGTFARADGRRAAIVADAAAAGVALPLLLGVAQLASIAILKRPLVPSPLMVGSLMTLLILPPAVAYATRARRIDSVRLLVQRAVLFAFARRTLQALSLVPLVILGMVLYRHRAESLAAVVDQHPFVVGASVVAAAVSLRFAAAIEARLDRLFFRERSDERRILRNVADAAARVDRVDDLSQLLEAEIERALHLESISLFVREPAGERFRARGVPWFLEPTSHVVETLARTEDFYDVDDASQNADDELERLWLTEAHVQMLVPLRGGAGSLIGFLALGEKRSELPFDAEDRRLLRNVAAAAALALDNHILRSSPTTFRTTAEVTEEEREPTAGYCPSCRRVFQAEPRVCDRDGATLVDAEIPLVVAGKYRLDAYLGAGGMGVVFRARDLTLGRPVAIKTLPRLSAAAAARFRREARFGAALTHPALAAVFAAETWRGRPLLILEYLAHGTLAARIATQRLPLHLVTACAIRISEALAALHETGVLHRDVKPSNIGFAAGDDAKLLDFGLARLLADTAVTAAGVPHDVQREPSSTDSTGLAGTPAYLPPEVIVGRRYEPSVDLWGLSMSLYEAVTGAHPFRDGSALRMMNRIVSDDVADPRRMRPDCPDEIAELLMRSLARDLRRRPRDGRALAQAWREAAAKLIS